MKYSIPIKKLKNIANPFEQAFLPNGEKISLEQVESFIKSNNINNKKYITNISSK